VAAAYSLKIITPQGVAYEGMAVHTLVPVENGYVGVLVDHAPYLVSSNGGKLTAREKSGAESVFQVGPGFFEVHNDEAVFLTRSCQKI
jgi:F-type H+-transporting ATPase subunit epsilon